MSDERSKGTWYLPDNFSAKQRATRKSQNGLLFYALRLYKRPRERPVHHVARKTHGSFFPASVFQTSARARFIKTAERNNNNTRNNVKSYPSIIEINEKKRQLAFFGR